ncbi:MAG: flagellar basal-body rod protein FlgF [Phycisphaerae bacterium]|nr:flagellar basal-body rod protein FlgF [Phycisphaerae bacterium]
MSDIAAIISARSEALSLEFETIAHNLSNVSTNGYKRRINAFSKALEEQGAETMDESGYDQAAKYSTYDFTQGRMIETGRQLDVALSGKGFFVIETPDGPLYTRNGMFRINSDSQLVDSEGRVVAGESGPITLPAATSLDQISVARNGTISADGLPVGQLRLVDFKENETKLVSAGLNCFAAPEGLEADPADALSVHQGFQEGSNVQLYEEMVDMMMVTRMYEANMRFSKVGSDTTQSLINLALA